MASDHDDEASRDHHEDVDRAAVLARRRRFVTAAIGTLAGTTMAVSATACPCLKTVPSMEPGLDGAEDAGARGAEGAEEDVAEDVAEEGVPAEEGPSSEGPPSEGEEAGAEDPAEEDDNAPAEDDGS